MLALVSAFTPPDPAIINETHGALLACRYQGRASLRFVHAKDIVSVVAMVPLPPHREEREDPHAATLYLDQFFVVEKLSFDMSWIGRVDDINDRISGCVNSIHDVINLPSENGHEPKNS